MSLETRTGGWWWWPVCLLFGHPWRIVALEPWSFEARVEVLRCDRCRSTESQVRRGDWG